MNYTIFIGISSSNQGGEGWHAYPGELLYMSITADEDHVWATNWGDRLYYLSDFTSANPGKGTLTIFYVRRVLRYGKIVPDKKKNWLLHTESLVFRSTSNSFNFE